MRQGRKVSIRLLVQWQARAFTHVMDETPVDTTSDRQVPGRGTGDAEEFALPRRSAGNDSSLHHALRARTARGQRCESNGAPHCRNGTRQPTGVTRVAGLGRCRAHFTVPSNSQTLHLNYTQQNRLQLSATPAEGASFTVSPASSDGFYDAGALVSISSNSRLGFRFSAWTETSPAIHPPWISR
jgi:hypothetical protein